MNNVSAINEFDFLHDAVLAARLAVLGVRVADCEERFILGRGPGGQKVNKTSSTVQLSHRPSGVEVRMQRERSQTRNRELAWTELATRLEERKRAAKAEVRAERELERRRNRPRSRAQKARMLAGKKHNAKRKSDRRGGGWSE
jgi:protein subunit release factor B